MTFRVILVLVIVMCGVANFVLWLYNNAQPLPGKPGYANDGTITQWIP